MRFSIITICWNNLEGLKNTHASLSKQFFTNYEWIIVDGASTDGTADYLKNFKDPGYIIVSEPDEGLYDAMNKGINLASGDYMVFMNSGDLFMAEDTLQIVSEEIDRHDKVAMIYGDALDYEPNGQTHYRKARNHNTIYRGMFTQHQSMFFIRLDREKQPTYDLNYKFSADYQFIIKYLQLEKQGYKIIKMSHPLSQFELGGLNETRRFQAMREDFLIRKNDLKLNPIKNKALHFAHYIHTLLKIATPKIMMKFRYSKI